jgi:hypothetical protein
VQAWEVFFIVILLPEDMFAIMVFIHPAIALDMRSWIYKMYKVVALGKEV